MVAASSKAPRPRRFLRVGDPVGSPSSSDDDDSVPARPYRSKRRAAHAPGYAEIAPAYVDDRGLQYAFAPADDGDDTWDDGERTAYVRIPVALAREAALRDEDPPEFPDPDEVVELSPVKAPAGSEPDLSRYRVVSVSLRSRDSAVATVVLAAL